jgi:Carboxypeptidase regulatory-like domain
MAAALSIGLATSTLAQPPGQVHGIAFDSLRGIPLSGALVWVAGRAQYTQADAAGRFRLEGIPMGPHQITVSHASLDSLGLSDITRTVQVVGDSQDLVIAVPSFGAFWARLCTLPVPSSGAVLVGTLLDAASGNVLPGAEVRMIWTEVHVGDSGEILERRYTLRSHADSSGMFVACDVPVERGVTLLAYRDSAVVVQVPVYDQQRRLLHFRLLLPNSADDAMHGGASPPSRSSTVIRGVVQRTDGKPIDGVRVATTGVPEQRTSGDGRFSLQGAAPGTRVLEFLAVGFGATSRVVNVTEGDTVEVAIVMEPTRALTAIEVRARLMDRFSRERDERRAMGFGYTMDSLEIGRRATLSGLMGGFPSLIASGVGGGITGLRIVSTTSITGSGACDARVFIDGRPSDVSQLNELRPSDIAWLEVYTRPGSVPIEFQTAKGCGAVAVFTKRL